jgi:hypothetical protein
MFENLIIYGAVYDYVETALSALGAFEKLNERERVGLYDAAVIDVRDGRPHIVKRMERTTLELIPELVHRGRPPIGVLAEPLGTGETALAVIGSTELEKAFKRVAQHALLTSERPLGSEALTSAPERRP